MPKSDLVAKSSHPMLKPSFSLYKMRFVFVLSQRLGLHFCSTISSDFALELAKQARVRGERVSQDLVHGIARQFVPLVSKRSSRCSSASKRRE